MRKFENGLDADGGCLQRQFQRDLNTKHSVLSACEGASRCDGGTRSARDRCNKVETAREPSCKNGRQRRLECPADLSERLPSACSESARSQGDAAKRVGRALIRPDQTGLGRRSWRLSLNSASPLHHL